MGQTIAAPYLEGQGDLWSANKFNEFANTDDGEAAKAFLLERLAQVKFVE